MLLNYLINGQIFFIFKKKVESAQAASGGSLNHPPTLADLICPRRV